MLEVRPFRGLMYQVKNRNLSSLLCPPYDVVSKDEEKKYQNRHPLNMVRLELPFRQEDGGRYQRAAKTLSSWIRRGVLKRDEVPSFYVLETRFSHPITRKTFIRRGFFGSVRVMPWGKGIFRHEKTLPKPLQDRMKCLKAMRVQVSPIFGIYEDPKRVSQRCFKNSRKELIAKATFPKGVQHQLFRLGDKGTKSLAKLLAQSRIVIADGHHRYETALAYASKHRGQVGRNHPALFTLMYLSPDHDAGLPVFPTHRVVIHKDNWLGKAQQFGALRAHSSLKSVIKEVEEKRGWGVYEKGQYCFQSAGATKLLPVQKLHATILKGLQKKDMFFMQDPKVAVSLVDRGQAGAGFFLKALTVRQIIDVATAGDVLPPKSTYFYPKVPAGFVLYPTK